MIPVRSPLRPLPGAVARWTSAAKYLRWLDALTGWALLIASGHAVLTDASPASLAVLALGIAGAVAWVPRLRATWRPLSALVGLLVSRGLRPGSRAWYVTPDVALSVLVSGRRGFRLVLQSPAWGEAGGVTVWRTAALVVPAEHGRR
jgi:hypothetical protein